MGRLPERDTRVGATDSRIKWRPSNATIPLSRTSTSVQLDEIFTALQSPVRADLSRLLESFGTALTHKPTAAEDRTQLPEVRGKTGAEGLNGALLYGGPAVEEGA